MNIKFIKLKRYIISKKSAVFVGVLFLISLGVYCVFTTHQYISNNLINELLKNSLLIILREKSMLISKNLLIKTILLFHMWHFGRYSGGEDGRTIGH